jgi:hypothetical protein
MEWGGEIQTDVSDEDWRFREHGFVIQFAAPAFMGAVIDITGATAAN